jgi:hypothetical protein
VQHNELKRLIKETIPAADIDADGYLKSGRGNPVRSANFLSRSGVDLVKKMYSQSAQTWSCKDPNIVFVGAE